MQAATLLVRSFRNLADAALELLAPVLAVAQAPNLAWLRADNNLDSIRDDPRYVAFIAKIEARLSAAGFGEFPAFMEAFSAFDSLGRGGAGRTTFSSTSFGGSGCPAGC